MPAASGLSARWLYLALREGSAGEGSPSTETTGESAKKGGPPAPTPAKREPSRVMQAYGPPAMRSRRDDSSRPSGRATLHRAEQTGGYRLPFLGFLSLTGSATVNRKAASTQRAEPSMSAVHPSGTTV